MNLERPERRGIPLASDFKCRNAPSLPNKHFWCYSNTGLGKANVGILVPSRACCNSTDYHWLFIEELLNLLSELVTFITSKDISISTHDISKTLDQDLMFTMTRIKFSQMISRLSHNALCCLGQKIKGVNIKCVRHCSTIKSSDQTIRPPSPGPFFSHIMEVKTVLVY